MDFHNKKAIYLQIVDYFLDSILLKNMESGDRIPSVRELAITVEVNPNTVHRAFGYMQDKGMIFNKRGVGYFISDEAAEIALSLKKKEFIDDELPSLFKNMEILGIKIEELDKLFKEFKTVKNEN